MYSDALDKVKVVTLKTGVPVDTMGWKSIALELVQPATGMIETDLDIKVGNTSNTSDANDPYLSLSNQSVKKMGATTTMNGKNLPYQVQDGLPLSDDEKKANALIRRVILNTEGMEGTKLDRKGRPFVMVTGAYAEMRLILACPGDLPQL